MRNIYIFPALCRLKAKDYRADATTGDAESIKIMEAVRVLRPIGGYGWK